MFQIKVLFVCFTMATAHAISPSESNIFVDLAKKTVPSVVNISTLSKPKNTRFRGGPEDFFRRFFEEQFRGQLPRMKPGPMPGPADEPDEDEDESDVRQPPRSSKIKPQPMSLGTGFIIDEKGLILTNNHVIDGADEIQIYFTEEFGEIPTEGKIVGRDPGLDLALIKVETKRKLIPLELGNSDALQVGEFVMAVGNPFGQGHSVTHGIVSAKGRRAPEFQLANYIQTDAPINPGNSGGPLVNLKGEVIGINNAIDQRAQGIGFAIPANLVKEVLPQLKAKGKVSRGYIGVLVDQLNPEIAEKLNMPKNLVAPFVTQVNPGEPADRAGLKEYDVIIEFFGKKIRSANDLVSAVTSVPVGDTAKIKVLRDGKEKELTIKVAERPGNDELAKIGKGKAGPDQSRKKDAKSQAGLELEKTPEGVVVSSVAYGSPADRAGILRGDVILEVDRKPVKAIETFDKIVTEKKTYLVRIKRTDPSGRDGFQVLLLDLK